MLSEGQEEHKPQMTLKHPCSPEQEGMRTWAETVRGRGAEKTEYSSWKKRQVRTSLFNTLLYLWHFELCECITHSRNYNLGLGSWLKW
jgi:hypothetical protein